VRLASGGKTVLYRLDAATPSTLKRVSTNIATNPGQREREARAVAPRRRLAKGAENPCVHLSGGANVAGDGSGLIVVGPAGHQTTFDVWRRRVSTPS